MLLLGIFTLVLHAYGSIKKKHETEKVRSGVGGGKVYSAALTRGSFLECSLFWLWASQYFPLPTEILTLEACSFVLKV